MRYKRAQEILSLLQPNAIENIVAKRFGSRHDGGYVIGNDLKHSDFMISMGVGSDISFEKEIIDRIVGVHLYDHTIDTLPQQDEKFTFFREKVDSVDGISLEEAISRAPKQHTYLLKMDIEGSEWRLLEESAHNLLKFRQIVLEVHNLMNIDSECDFHRMKTVLKWLNNSFYILNVHPNNNGNALVIGNLLLPDVIELTFLNKVDYVLAKKNQQQILHEVEILNSPCDPNSPELFLQRIIYWSKLDDSFSEETWPNSVYQIGSRWYPPRTT